MSNTTTISEQAAEMTEAIVANAAGYSIRTDVDGNPARIVDGSGELVYRIERGHTIAADSDWTGRHAHKLGVRNVRAIVDAIRAAELAAPKSSGGVDWDHVNRVRAERGLPPVGR